MLVFLIGFMGSGKTTLGKKVANSIGFNFIDLDNDIIKKTGKSINEIFEEKGEEYFRNIENETLKSYLGLENTIVATGGGAPCYLNNLEIMNMNGITIYLKLPPKVIYTRVANAKNKRPLLRGKTDDEVMVFIQEKLNEREPYYSKARYVVDAFDPQVADVTSLLFETC
jgi:shikimate kinase